MNLSIVIPVKDDARQLEDCLDSIAVAATEAVCYEVIVVDNGSADDSQAVGRDNGAVVLVAPDANVGALRNLGASHAAGEILAFIDADCTVDVTWFESIVPYISDEKVICFGSPPKPPVSATWVQDCWFQIRKKALYQRTVFEVDWLESMNLFLRRESFLHIGGFDESMVTCEDYDLCKRIASLGPVVCDKSIIAYHHGEAETVSRFYRKERWRGVSNLGSLRKHGFDLAEMPSVAFPLIYMLILIVAMCGLLLVLSGKLSLAVWLPGLLIWQLPLLALSLNKIGTVLPFTRVFGVIVLLNVYFFARGLSLFVKTSWKNRLAAAYDG